MVFIKIPKMVRSGMVRYTKKGNSYTFLQNQFTPVTDLDDIKFFTEEDRNKDIYEVVDDIKKVPKEESATKPTYTEEYLYSLNRAQQEEIIKKLGYESEIKKLKKESDRVNFIMGIRGR